MSTPTGPPVRRDRPVLVTVAQHDEVVIRGGDPRQVLDRLATWVRDHHVDIRIIGLQWTNDWVLDLDGIMDTDQLPDHTVTMQFRIGPQQEHGWVED